jgi:hypothetical protein
MNILNRLVLMLSVSLFINITIASNYLYEVKQFKSFSTGGSYVIEGNYCLANQCEYKKLRLMTDTLILLLKNDDEFEIKYSDVDWTQVDRVNVYVDNSVIVKVVLFS